MYWIPIVFIVYELFYISTVKSLVKYTSITELVKKYDNRELKDYVEKNYVGYGVVAVVILVFIFLEFIYFMVGLTKPIMDFSLVYIGVIILSSLLNIIIKKRDSIEKTIKRANLTNFTTTDIKFQRLLKMNELKPTKVYHWREYMFTFIKLAIFLTIVIMHYKFETL